MANPSKWLWRAEKFRHTQLHLQAVDSCNPVPLLMQARDVEDLKRITGKFNIEHGSDLEFLSEDTVNSEDISHLCLDTDVDWEHMKIAQFYLPGGVCGALIQKPHLPVSRRFEFKDEKSHKFWEISVAATSHTSTWGRVGGKSQSNRTKEFHNVSKIPFQTVGLAAEYKIKEKIRKGYVEVVQDDSVQDDVVQQSYQSFISNMGTYLKTTYAQSFFICWTRNSEDLEGREVGDSPNVGLVVQTSDFCHFYDRHKMAAAAAAVAHLFRHGGSLTILPDGEAYVPPEERTRGKSLRIPLHRDWDRHLFENQKDRRLPHWKEIKEGWNPELGCAVTCNVWDGVLRLAYEFERSGGDGFGGMDSEFFSRLVPFLRTLGIWDMASHAYDRHMVGGDELGNSDPDICTVMIKGKPCSSS